MVVSGQIPANDPKNTLEVLNSFNSRICDPAFKKDVIIHTHTSYPVHRFLPVTHHIASIRHPVKRLISHIKHIRGFYNQFEGLDKLNATFFMRLNNHVSSLALSPVWNFIELNFFRNFYRIWFNNLFFTSTIEEVSLNPLGMQVKPSSNKILLEEIKQNFLSIPVLYEKDGFNSHHLDYLSSYFNLEVIMANENIIQSTVTNPEFISEEELDWIDLHAPRLLKDDIELFEMIKDWQESNMAKHSTFKRVRNWQESNVQKHTNPPLHANRVRIEIQNLLLQHQKQSDLKDLFQGVATIKSWLERELPDDRRVMDNIIPFEILLHELNMEPFCNPDTFSELFMTPAGNGAIQGFRDWLQLIRTGGNLFDKQANLKETAVFGSMSTAFLIVMEAKQAGIRVLCCIDSNPSRTGNQILNVPIISFEDLKCIDRKPETIILSNEKDHEEEIKKILHPYLPGSQLKILSWKELAAPITRTSKALP